MSYSFPVIDRCRFTVTISVNKLLLRRRCEANPLVNRETMLESPLVGQTTRAVDRARAVQEATDGTACPERETEPTEVDFNAAGIGLQS